VAPDGHGRMLELVRSLPDQLESGLTEACRAGLGRPARFDNAVVAGMGGSGIGGDICRGLLFGESPVPLLVWRDYELPALVSRRTLFLAVSYSGETEETLAAFRAARRRAARIVCIATGGTLARLAQRYGYPMVPVPAGMPPRAALGHLFASIIVVLSRLGVCRSYAPDIREAARLLRRRAATLGKQAGLLAWALRGSLPVVYSSSRLLDCVANRWRCQLNENAKVMCHTNVLPELDHNEIIGIGRPGFLRSRAVLVTLLDSGTHPRTRRRVRHTLAVTAGGFRRVLPLRSRGRSALARVCWLIALGDLVSCELARLNRVDPMAIARIDALKRLMAGRR